ncbi:MAG: LuxR C-terminal-related transcriptional regulator [Nakamurella sp.]
MTIVELVFPITTPNGTASTRSDPMNVHHRRRTISGTTTPLAPPRLSVIDPNTLTRAGLPLVLTDFAIIGSFATVEAMLAARPRADITLLEVGDAGFRAEGGVRSLSRAGYRVCLYTFEYRQAVIARYIAAGARGVVSKADPVDSLAGALSRIAAGGTAISEEFRAARVGDPLPDKLTARQLQILAGRARGETFHSIARRLEISERTAQDHWSAVARRFEAFLRSHSPADLERSLGLDNGVASLEYDETR